MWRKGKEITVGRVSLTPPTRLDDWRRQIVELGNDHNCHCEPVRAWQSPATAPEICTVFHGIATACGLAMCPPRRRKICFCRGRRPRRPPKNASHFSDTVPNCRFAVGSSRTPTPTVSFFHNNDEVGAGWCFCIGLGGDRKWSAGACRPPYGKLENLEKAVDNSKIHGKIFR